MATRAIRPKREDTPLGGNWQPIPERAPSIIRTDRPVVARILAMIAVVLGSVGGLAMIMAGLGKGYVVAPEWGFVFFTLGVVLLLFHAFRDTEIQYRRVYSIAGFLLLVVGIALRVYPVKGVWGALFLSYGVPCLAVGALFLIAIVRNETDAFVRLYILRVFGALGALMILAGLIGGNLSQSYVETEGALLLLLGLLFFSAYIGLQESGSNEGYWAGLTLGVVAGIVFIVALFRSIFGNSFLVPSGFVLLTACAMYLMVSFGTCSDLKLVVLVRRELSALFYSPIAYFVFFAVMIVGWISFIIFLRSVLSAGGGVFQPVVHFFLNFFTVICVIFVVPVITMRLLSEEKRSGTLEVLLTAPVNEWTIVLSKFIAVLLFYILAFVPWGIFLIAMRIISDEPFDFRPMLSFIITFIVTGAGFVSAGLFFSSLTRNQIVAAVVSLIFMGLFTALCRFFIPGSGFWTDIISYISYLELWINSLEGLFAPRYLIFHVSLAVFFLFLTVKLLEARKWTA